MKRIGIIFFTVGVLGALVALGYVHKRQTETSDSSIKSQSDTSQQNGQQPDPTTDPQAAQAGREVDPTTAPADSMQIAITPTTYTPAAISIARGSTVVWTNGGIRSHTIASRGTDGPKSGNLKPGRQYAYMFTKVGTYVYYNQDDSAMRGTITVTE